MGVLRTIVADDEPEFRDWLRVLLDDNQDFRIVGEAGSGPEALQIIESTLPDLVLVDIYMPGMDGLEVARHIRRRFPEIRVILVSAYEEHVYERLAAEEGALAFIPKANLSTGLLREVLQKEKSL